MRLIIHKGRKEEDWKRCFVLSFPIHLESKNHVVWNWGETYRPVGHASHAGISPSDQAVSHSALLPPKTRCFHMLRRTMLHYWKAPLITSILGYSFWNLQFEHFRPCVFWRNWVSWRKQNVCVYMYIFFSFFF